MKLNRPGRLAGIALVATFLAVALVPASASAADFRLMGSLMDSNDMDEAFGLGIGIAVPFGQGDFAFDASIYYFQGYWKLESDEALVVRAPVIPECASWNLQISNYWMESLDYRYHRIHVNKSTAVYEDDGSVTIVLAHENPGSKYPNYLETAGHNLGGMLFRWIRAEEHPPIEAQVVKFADL